MSNTSDPTDVKCGHVSHRVLDV